MTEWSPHPLYALTTRPWCLLRTAAEGVATPWAETGRWVTLRVGRHVYLADPAEVKAKARAKPKTAAKPKPGERWVTLDNGQHVLMGADGQPVEAVWRERLAGSGAGGASTLAEQRARPASEVEAAWRGIAAHPDSAPSEAEALARWLWTAERAGVSLDQQRADVAATVQEELNQSKVAIRVTPEVLAKIAQDGRIKNQYETGTSAGVYDPDYRRQSEDAIFTTTRDTPDRERPIYGYMESTRKGDEGHGPSYYGDVRVVLKDSVRARTTVTLYDSLASAEINMGSLGTLSRAVPVDHFDWTGVAPMGGLVQGLGGLTKARKAGRPVKDDPWPVLTGTRFESQIHGGVTLDDIDRVVVPTWTSLSPATRKALKAHGVKVETYTPGFNPAPNRLLDLLYSPKPPWYSRSDHDPADYVLSHAPKSEVKAKAAKPKTAALSGGRWVTLRTGQHVYLRPKAGREAITAGRTQAPKIHGIRFAVNMEEAAPLVADQDPDGSYAAYKLVAGAEALPRSTYLHNPSEAYRHIGGVWGPGKLDAAGLAKRAKVRKEGAQRAISAWAGGELEGSALNVSVLHKAAVDEFGGMMGPFTAQRYQDGLAARKRVKDLAQGTSVTGEKLRLDSSLAPFESRTRRLADMPAEPDLTSERKLLRQMYTDTQADLASLPGDTVTLYRGLRGSWSEPFHNGGKVNIRRLAQPLQSWTLDPLMAGALGDWVLVAQVPKSRILSTWHTGLGTRGETEVVVLGGHPADLAMTFSQPRNYKAAP